ncbi:MAG: hypothetical protein WCP98_05410 [Actinomycetes bacterium]
MSSPIGDLPFKPTRLRYASRGLEVEGVMGAWPAKVQLDASDVPAIVALVRVPLALAFAAAALLGMVRLAARYRHACSIGKGEKS